MNFLILILTFTYIENIRSHMEMSSPIIPKSQYDTQLRWYDKDYTNIFPIGNRYAQDLPYCHHPLDKSRTTTIQAGSVFTAQFQGEAQHDGGHCEFSLSYDGIHFAVFHTVISECLRKSKTISINIPNEAPSGNATLSWTWINRIGERELYMNCARISIINGPKSGSFTGPTRLIANLPGFPTIHQFKFSIKGVYFYRNRTSTRTGLDNRGRPIFEEIINKNAKVLPGKNYFYDPFHPNLDPTEGFPDYGRDENEDD